MSSKLTCTRRFHFSYGHRLMNYDGPCSSLHGHNATVYVTVERKELNSLDMVVDFSVIKKKIGSWIDECWDHAFIYCQDDTAVMAALSCMGPTNKAFGIPGNPTAEVLARYLLEQVCPKVLADTGVKATSVIFFETDNCSARCSVAPAASPSSGLESVME